MAQIPDISTAANTTPHQGFTLITGAAMGIGREFARALTRAGNARLLLVDVRAEDLPPLADQLRQEGAQQVQVFAEDLATKSGPRHVFDFCRRNGLEIEALINNAAVGMYAPFVDHPIWRIEQIIRVNVISLVALTRQFLPTMVRHDRGTIVNVTSISAFESSPGWSVYGGTKAFVQSFTESLQDELRDTGVYVTAVCPGVTNTEFFAAAGADCPEDVQPAEEVVTEALAGIERRLPLIVTGRSNRIRIKAQRANLRRLMARVKGGLRKVGMVS